MPSAAEPELNWTPNRAQVFVNQHPDRQPDRRAGEFLRPDLAGAHDGGRLRHHPRDARLPAQQFRRPGRRPTSSIPTHGASAAFRSPPTANQLIYGVATERRRLRRRPDQDQQIVRSAGEHGATTSTASTRMRRLAAPSVQHLERTDKMRAGASAAVFHPTEKSSIYVMRGTSFNPVGRQPDDLRHHRGGRAQPAGDAAGRDQTNEIGAKAEVLNGQLTLQTAVLRHRENQSARHRTGQQTVTMLARCRDGAWMGSQRRRLSDQ